MPSCNTYHLTWVSLTLDVGYLFMAAITICSDFGAQKIKSDTVSQSICYGVMGPDAMILVF